MNAIILFFGFLASPVLCVDFTNLVFGTDNVEGVPAAFGDFNSDELTDVFMLSDKFRTIQSNLPQFITLR